MQLADSDPGQTGRVNAHGNERLLNSDGEIFLRGWRLRPGTSAATSHFALLISMTAMTVLSCSRAVRDRLASKDCDMGCLLLMVDPTAPKDATPSPLAP